MAETITLKAPDISCDHCINTIRKAVTKLPGVEFVKGDIPAKTVTMRYEASRTKLDQIKQAMGEEDYPVASVN